MVNNNSTTLIKLKVSNPLDTRNMNHPHAHNCVPLKANLVTTCLIRYLTVICCSQKQKLKRRFSKWEHLPHKHKHKKNERVHSTCAYAYVMLHFAVFTSENRDDKSTSSRTRQSTVCPPSCLTLRGAGIERWFRQEMVFCACICPHAYVANVLTCLSLCLCLCPSENQPIARTTKYQGSFKINDTHAYNSLPSE